MKIDPNDYRVRDGHDVDRGKWPTRGKPLYNSKKSYRKLVQGHVDQPNDYQELLYPSNSHALQRIFRATNAAGKNGAIKHVMSGVNPQGCRVFSFKHPGVLELQHDFLWRTTRNLPEHGRIGIFNRSYCEEVLIVRVHPEILRCEGIPNAPPDDDMLWHDRFCSIVDLEKHLHANGTRIVTFFLHLFRDEQRKRFLEGIEEPDKNWKFSAADFEERKFWNDYMRAHGQCLGATGTADSRWYVMHADDQADVRAIVSRLVIDALEGLDMAFAVSSPARKRELEALRKQRIKQPQAESE